MAEMTPPATNETETLQEAESVEPSAVALATTRDGDTPEKKLVKKIIRKKRRPARPQVDPSEVKTGELPQQTGTVFNIWYNKWSGGDREDKYLSKHHAEGRCNIRED